jgi:hypothetical protein
VGLSCIGAWVGIVYNQFDKVEDKDRAEKTYQFFKNGVFRDDESYKRFPINTVFGPDWESIGKALTNFVIDSNTYKDTPSPQQRRVRDQKDIAERTTARANPNV